MKKSLKYIVPVVDISMIVSLCKLLESILDKQNVKSVEYIFVFCCVWAIGAGFAEKDGRDYRKEFSAWWKDKFKTTVKFPVKGTVFDHFVDIENNKFEEWSKLQSKDIEKVIDTSKSISNYTVPTSDTVSAQYLIKQFISVNHSPLLVGNAGCGKTQICKGLLNDLATQTEQYLYQTVNFNYYTDSALLQTILEQQLEKKAGKTYAPVGKYQLIYFVDDLNMPELDKYNTQNAIALLRQHKDYEHWYDRGKWLLKDVKNTQYLACMNPTAGSFSVNPRLQRHFWLLAIPFPEQNSLTTIYSTFLNKHFSKNFKPSILEQIMPIIKAALTLHSDVEKNFRKTAVNFHYEFNVRHLTNIFQGLLMAQPQAIKEPDQIVKLWIHESERIYGDRLVNYEHLNTYKALMGDLAKRTFAKFNLSKYLTATGGEPLVFAQFVHGIEEKLYDQFGSIKDLSERLHEALKEYNDTNPVMDLVLFEDAMKHVCRITRIISGDGGHALLVGVGGSGKQSLSRLSSFICMYLTTTIMISSTYGINDLKTDLQNMYNKAGVKDEGILFLFTEGQITNERFLVFINDLLSSGEIADLFATEDKDSIVNNIRPAVKGAGLIDNKDNCWNFFISRVKRNLHMALCFSPVGESFRSRARKFPAIVNCTVIDWFHPWPEEALLSVAGKFLEDIEMQSDEVRDAIVKFMPFSFKTVNEASSLIFEMERRYVYTTPKSFLELIKLFKVMHDKKKNELEEAKEKYETGVIKLKQTGEVVSKLEEELKESSVVVEEKKREADAQAEVVGKEKTKVEAENEKANKEAEECARIKAIVEKESEKVNKELEQALPLVEKAKEALKGLDVKDFQELKVLKTPPKDVENVFFCVLNLLAGVEPSVPVDKNFKLKVENVWKAAVNVQANPKQFLQTLNDFKEKIDQDLVRDQNFKAIRSIINQPTFTPENLTKKSKAAGGVCSWLLNITKYYDVTVEVEPLKQAVRDATQQLQEANEKKEAVDALVAKLQAELSVLEADFQKAMDEKNAAEAEAARCERRLDLANRLVKALGSESERWSNSIIDIGEKLQVIVGDVLLASAFVSYVGPFNKKFRDMITNDKFLNFFKQYKIPMSNDPNPLTILTDEATIASWNNQKLPADRVSTENGAILTNSERYGLIIDPQLQGITWLREKEKNNDLQVTRLNNPKMIRTLEAAIESGQSVLIENMENQIDAVIAPVYGRAFIKRGKSKYIKMGDKELTLNPNFKLFMHTKLSNPHYPPEIQAECTLINFTVTEMGLEDQLLSLVVKKERPDLAQQKEELIQQQNEFKIKLKQLEDGLLYQLANAEGDILENIELIENLEYSKKLSEEIKAKVEVAIQTEIMINDASEAYRPAASRGALIFFLLNELYKIHSFYKFSLDSFVIVVNRAIDVVAEQMNPKKPEPAQPVEGEEGGEEGEQEEEEEVITPRTLKKRVVALTESITYESFNYTRRGLFERHKLLVATMLCMRILARRKEIDELEMIALIKKEVSLDAGTPPDNLKFLPEGAWAAVKGLETVKSFSNLVQSMEGEALQWRRWYTEEKAESAELPRAFKDISLFQRLLLLRAMRPDRLSSALTQFVHENMGEKYIEQDPFDMEQTYKEMSPKVPVFFVLFPGVDPTPEVERVGKLNGVSEADGKFINLSMGQGQEEIAINKLKFAGKEGAWIMLQNVHLMQSWMKVFERNLEIVTEEVHPNFRCFISSEPPPLPDMEIIPESILQNSIKVANEAPQDLKANLRRAFKQFGPEHFSKAEGHKTNEFKALLFGLCMYHSLILGRRKFGSQGWSRHYNFNDGDLTICGDVLHNYLTKYEKVPYDDLRYIYGEIMYGGHITDNWDRRTNNTYLKVILRPELLQGMQLTLAPGFKSPDPSKFDREAYRRFIEEKLPPEVPQMFGLHPNAEIGYLTQQSDTIFSQILQITGGGSSGGGGKKKEDTVKEYIKKFLDELPPDFVMMDIAARAKEKTPYNIVCLQECERMNILLGEIRRSLNELDAGLKGQLNITDAMEGLSNALSINKVFEQWEKYAYYSKKALSEWFTDLLQRVQQLVVWSSDLETPKTLWIAGLFNPMSFLTAIMQVTARTYQLPLDDMCLKTDVTNITDHEEIQAYPEAGAYVHGFFLEGAAWEMGRGGEQGYLTEQQPKDLHPQLPVMNVSAIRLSSRKSAGLYECPAYVTSMRGPTFVFTANLQMESEESDPNKWILAGVALLLSSE